MCVWWGGVEGRAAFASDERQSGSETPPGVGYSFEFLPACQTQTSCSLCDLELWETRFLLLEFLPCSPQVALRLPPAARVLSRVLQVGATPIAPDPQTCLFSGPHTLILIPCALSLSDPPLCPTGRGQGRSRGGAAHSAGGRGCGPARVRHTAQQSNIVSA